MPNKASIFQPQSEAEALNDAQFKLPADLVLDKPVKKAVRRMKCKP